MSDANSCHFYAASRRNGGFHQRNDECAGGFYLSCLLFCPCMNMPHAWMANKLGDTTALQAGRHTINPLASFEPLGALFLLLFGFGWAKPVPVDPRRFKNPRRDMALTALAGPVSNILAALVGAILYLALAIFAFQYNVPTWLYYFIFSTILNGKCLAGCVQFVAAAASGWFESRRGFSVWSCYVPVLPVPESDYDGCFSADLFRSFECTAFVFAVGPYQRDFLFSRTSFPSVWGAVSWKRSPINWKDLKGHWTCY